jgi:DNA-binding XRE family transcriptional regulator
MQRQPNLAERDAHTDHVILGLLISDSSHRPWSVDEVEREVGGDAVDGLARLCRSRTPAPSRHVRLADASGTHRRSAHVLMPPKKSAANQALGRAIRSARRERGFAQEAFAARAGIDRSYFGAIERGEFNVSLDKIVALAKGLGLSASELLARARL